MKRSGMKWHEVEKSPSDEQYITHRRWIFVANRRGFLDYARGHKSCAFVASCSARNDGECDQLSHLFPHIADRLILEHDCKAIAAPVVPDAHIAVLAVASWRLK